jgi:DNA-binding SARP family transcriptional activator/tetratricopeptide (TPR) repeat protein
MKKLTFFFLMFIALVAAQAHDMEAMKYYNLGLSSTLTSKKIEYFTEALRLNPALVEAYEKRGLLYYFQEKYDGVIRDFQKYIELAPAKAEDFRMLGLGFLRSRIYNQAIDNFNRAIKLKPNCADAYADRAEAYRLIGRYNDAISDSTKAIEIWADPGTMSDAYRTRAKSYLAIGKNTEAFADNRKVMSLDPRYPSIWGKLKPLSIIGGMCLFVLNGAVFLFLFELRPGLLKFGRYRHLNIFGSKLLAPQTTDSVTIERLHALFVDIEKVLLTLKGSQSLIFSYLEENIYNLLTDEKKEFLIKTSIFPRVNPDFCDQLLNIRHSREILKDLEENHLFTSPFDDDDKWYTYHQFFRDFLQTKLITELGCKAVLELYKQTAGLLENFAEDEKAISDYLDAESFSKVWPLLNKNEPKTVDFIKLLPNPNHHKVNDAPVDDQNEIPKLQTPFLKVYLFGKFRVFLGDREIYDNRWKSKKAQMIFKYLLYHRSKGYLKKDVLMELLWPEDDPVKTAKRFHVALASLRKTLEPEITRGTPSSYISRSGDAYCIDIGDEGYVDIDNFKKELKLAKKTKDSEELIDHLLKAEAIYRGDFLEEDLYVQWCDEEREGFKEKYLQLLEEIIKYYHVKKDYKKCIYYANKYLKTDIYAESIYQLLMIYYSRIGNNAMVNKIFKKCKDNIIKGLDCPVSKETEKLYLELTSDPESTPRL